MVVLALAGYACSSATAAAPSAMPASGSQSQVGSAAGHGFNASGIWEGKSVATCLAGPFSIDTRCNAINQIAITMVQDHEKITGFYKCSTGNTDCRNQNDSGTIFGGSLKNGKLFLRIGMPDGSSCLFNGSPVAANLIRGGYSCYQGGGFEEQGRFEVGRNY